MTCATYLKNGTGAASRYLTACNYKVRTAFTYHSERFNARATHIRHYPREPREVHRTSVSRFPPANRVRNATASGSVDISRGKLISCQSFGFIADTGIRRFQLQQLRFQLAHLAASLYELAKKTVSLFLQLPDEDVLTTICYL